MADPAATAPAAPAPPAKRDKGRQRKKVNQADIEADARPASAAEAPPPSTDAAAAPTDAIPGPPADAFPPPPADAAPSHPHPLSGRCAILTSRISHLESFMGNQTWNDPTVSWQQDTQLMELTKRVSKIQEWLTNIENFLERITLASSAGAGVGMGAGVGTGAGEGAGAIQDVGP